MKTDILFQWSRRTMFLLHYQTAKPKKRNGRKNHPRGKLMEKVELFNHDGSGWNRFWAGRGVGISGYHNNASSFQVKSFKKLWQINLLQFSNSNNVYKK